MTYYPAILKNHSYRKYFIIEKNVLNKISYQVKSQLIKYQFNTGVSAADNQFYNMQVSLQNKKIEINNNNQKYSMKFNQAKVTLNLLILLIITIAKNEQIFTQEQEKEVSLNNKKVTKVEDVQTLLTSNFQMACHETRNDPQYFKRHTVGQNPRFLWIGCSDSRVIPEHMVGAKIGDLFVHRNVANQVNQLDQNAMAVLQYAVQYLKVTNIVVVGHYDCGGIKASLGNKSFGHLQSWLSQIRQIRYRHNQQLRALPQKQRFKRLVEINVQQQVTRISRIPIVQRTWKKGQKLNIVGLVYDIQTGLLNNVTSTIRGITDMPRIQQVLIEQ